MEPWQALVHSSEQYGLVYETKYLMELGSAINLVYGMAISFAAEQALQQTILQGIPLDHHHLIILLANFYKYN